MRTNPDKITSLL